MDDLISRSALINEFKRLTLGENSLIERFFADGVYAVIETFPAVDAVEVKHGRWLKTKEPLGWQDVGWAELTLTDIRKEIILALADCNLNITEVARQTYMSRNNVVYHIERIKEITGKNPMSFYDLIDLLKLVKGGADND